MHPAFGAVGALFLAACTAAAHPVSQSPESIAITAAEEAKAPALVAALIDGDQVRYLAHGKSRLQGGAPIDHGSWFQIASLSKIVTGIVANSLVVEGKLDSGRPVADYLPEAHRDAVAGMTVRDLLHHRSGLDRDSVSVGRVDGEPMLDGLSDDGLFADLVKVERIGKPGEHYEYSNLGYGLLGYVLEQASGMTYEALVEAYVTEPYGLTRLATEPAAEEVLATPYAKDEPLRETKPWHTGRLTPASGLYADTASLARLTAEMLRTYREGDQSHPLYLTREARTVEGERIYGFGFNCQPLRLSDGPMRLCYHSGDMDGYAGVVMIVPEANKALVMLTSRGGAWKNRLQAGLLKAHLANPATE